MDILHELCNVFILLLLFCQKSVSQSIVTCSCDLTLNACDADCCCDSECAPDDVRIFQCSNATVNQDSNLCVNELVFVNNLPSSVVVEDSGLFCIIRQQDASNNFYTEPVILNTTADFETTSQQYPTYSYDISTTTSTATTTYYTAGDRIDVNYANGLPGKFLLPVPGIANACVGSNPASFLTDQTSSCNRRFVLSSTTCSNNSFLDPSIYSSFTISQRPILNTTEATLIDIILCEGTTPPSIEWNSTSCLNVAKSISYTITYNGTTGITAACVSFPQISEISKSNLVQTFSINFVPLATVLNNNTSTRSGNPGYLTGKPLRTAVGSLGNLTFDTSPMTLISSNSDGTCNGNVNAQQVNFREDARTGCLLSIQSTNSCAAISTNISNILSIPENIKSFVSTYGNTLLNSTIGSDWIEIMLNGVWPTNMGTTVEGECTDMLVGVNYKIFYANTGSIANAQPRIIGVQYSADAKTISKECVIANCVQNVEVSTSVTFTDASSSPSVVLKERPTVNARLPSDFFFPFTGTAN